MINKREILDLAGKLGLGPQVVEKDYALGWVLAGINHHDALSKDWVFKGGTCLKKCFIETYRFSEDLDFTLKEDVHLDEGFLKQTFAEIGEWIYDQSGLEIPADMQKFDIYENPRGSISCEGAIAYRGPVSPRGKNIPRIKLDLTADERIVLTPVRVPVFHPYGDAPKNGIEVLSYAYEEAFAEKMRALAERTRPRDLYDIVNLYRNVQVRPSSTVLLDVLRQKCEFKGIAIPKFEDLAHHRDDLEGAWDAMLRHQLPALPSMNSFWDALPEIFNWLQEGTVPAIPAAYPLSDGETVIRERTLSLPLSGKIQSYLEVIRFAATNHLCIDLDYQGSARRIEPYSLREIRDGKIILHVWSIDKDAHESYHVEHIQGAQINSQPFSPRYEIELTPSGPVAIVATSR